MSNEVKSVAQEQAQETYKKFLQFIKYFCYIVLFLVLIMSWQNWLVDGTGSQGDPALYEEYLERMEEMKEEFKNK
tara:strand:- start:478 stop:702 length:225 start_codon:yes stop_codon:yes gene_type:complete